jgi:phosphotriesterase-related protein
MPGDGPSVMTVLGPVAPENLGPTLMHEHLLADFSGYWSPPAEAGLRAVAESSVEITNLGVIRRNPFLNRDNLLFADFDLAVKEVMEFRKLGGGTLLEVTLPDVGRDPVGLQAISRLTGLNIVAGCGHYVHLVHPASLDQEPIESITDRLVTELVEGIGNTGVRPGIIGEIGTWDPLHPREEKVLRAAARAQQITGKAVTVHLHVASRTGHKILDILQSEGADLSRVVLDHLDITFGHLDVDFDQVIEYQCSLIDRGCFIEYDTCGAEIYCPAMPGLMPSFWLPSDLVRARGIVTLFARGYGNEVLISHDVWTKINLTRYGGFGYGHILRTFVHQLCEVGLDEQGVQQLLVENPRRVLTPAR